LNRSNLLASLVSGSALPVKKHGISGLVGNGNGGFSDTGLKAYWKYNESSSPILNSSESDDSVGNTSSTGQGIMTGGSFEQGGTPIGESVLFDGSNDFMTVGSSKSLWNFWHNSNALWTWAFWMKGVSLDWDSYFYADGDGSENQALRVRFDGQTTYSGLQFVLRSDGNTIINDGLSDHFIPDVSSWYFYCFTYDMSLGSDNLVARRDNNDEETLSKSAGSTADDNADYSPIMAKKTTASANFGNFLISEFSCWNKKMSDQDQASLYNDGDGLEIY